MVYQIDDAIGRIVESLKRAGQWENTIIVFTSDHGDFLCDHGRLRKTVDASDNLLHLPFVMRAPGSDLPTQVHTPMSNVDVLPTLTTLAGVPGPAWVHGTDITRVVREGEDHVALAYCSGGRPESVNVTVYDDDHRYTIYPHTGYEALYNHGADPGESVNLVATKPERAAAMRRTVESQLLLHRNPIAARVCAW
jgi:arylsulfatase A-like enzyme